MVADVELYAMPVGATPRECSCGDPASVRVVLTVEYEATTPAGHLGFTHRETAKAMCSPCGDALVELFHAPRAPRLRLVG